MKRGPYGTNRVLYEEHIEEIERLRRDGFGYGTIAEKVGIPQHLVRDWVKHIPVDRGEATRKGMTVVPFSDLISKASKRRRLIEERGLQCEVCGLTKWLGEPITLELHNHTKEEKDCQLLCPNCHSQTDGWRNRRAGVA